MSNNINKKSSTDFQSKFVVLQALPYEILTVLERPESKQSFETVDLDMTNLASKFKLLVFY